MLFFPLKKKTSKQSNIRIVTSVTDFTDVFNLFRGYGFEPRHQLKTTIKNKDSNKVA